MVCKDITDEEVELFALAKVVALRDELIDHLKTCPVCRDRVTEAQMWADALRRLKSGDSGPSTRND